MNNTSASCSLIIAKFMSKKVYNFSMAGRISEQAYKRVAYKGNATVLKFIATIEQTNRLQINAIYCIY
jgi:hypothetical protein